VSEPVIFTIGHSTRTLDDFLALLRAHEVGQVADIRTMPRSRRHPHFAIDALSASLPQAGVAYRHVPGLGGLRKPQPDSQNRGWRHSGFRGYADYMQTAEFESALDELMAFAAGNQGMAALSASRGGRDGESGRGWGPSHSEDRRPPRTAVMCAEAVWWRCHRQLVADALVARGVEVAHITSDAAPAAHQLTDFARVVDRHVTYPGLI
jgi:uncharacterized protein (DUF488 family)